MGVLYISIQHSMLASSDLSPGMLSPASSSECAPHITWPAGGTGFTRPAPKHRKSEGVTQNIVACVVYILASERERPTVSTSGNALAFMGERIEPDS